MFWILSAIYNIEVTTFERFYNLAQIKLEFVLLSENWVML